MPPKGKKEFYSLISEFLHHLRLRNYALRAITDSETYLRDFVWYLEDCRIYEIRRITKEDLEQYLLFLKYEFKPRRGTSLSDHAIYHSRWGKILLFFKYLEKRGCILYNPTLRIERPRLIYRPTREPLTLTEVECLLSQPDLKKKWGIRDRAILELFYSTGVRRGELLGLEIFDVDLKEKTVRVRKAKGGKERIVPIGKAASFYLKKYLDEVRTVFIKKNPGDNALFLSYTGKPIDSQALQQIMKRHIEHSGIKKKVTPHILRHTVATHLFEGGADTFSIRDLLGHVRAETTQFYAKTSFEGLEKAHHDCHPRGKGV